MDIIDRINELIAEAEKEPTWTAVQALRCLRKELIMNKEEMMKLLQDKFSDIWDCEIDHRRFQNTVGEILTEAVEIITDQS